MPVAQKDSQAPSRLFALNASRNAPKRPVPPLPSDEEVLRTAFYRQVLHECEDEGEFLVPSTGLTGVW